MTFRTAAMAVGMVVSLAGCAAKRPMFYPNEHLTEVGQAQADTDINECMALAEQYVKSGGKGTQVAKDVTVAAGTGAAVGGVVGAIEGGAGTRAAQGAAGGATAALVTHLFRSNEPTPLYVSYVNTCLAERGYRVLGWE